MARTTAIETDIVQLKTTSITDPATNVAVSTDILDSFSWVIITTTWASNSQTLQTPTNTDEIKRFSVINNDSSTHTITVNWFDLEAWFVKYFIWDGTSWTSPAWGWGGWAWWDITGTLSDQTDLQSALDAKAPSLTADENYVTDAQLVIIWNTTASFLTAQETKVNYLTITQAQDIDQMAIDIAALANGMVYKGNWDASAGTFPWTWAAQTGWLYYVSVAWTVDSVEFAIGDNIVATVDNASTW